MGCAQDGFLDQDKYDIIFKTAENLNNVPIDPHPAPVNSAIINHTIRKLS